MTKGVKYLAPNRKTAGLAKSNGALEATRQNGRPANPLRHFWMLLAMHGCVS